VKHSLNIGSGIGMHALVGAADELRLRFLAIPGYELPGEVSLAATSGEPTELTVELTAK
jgi:hypothetical protein